MNRVDVPTIHSADPLILPILLPNMVEAENFSDHPRTSAACYPIKILKLMWMRKASEVFVCLKSSSTQ